MNFADLVVILILGTVIVLIIRSMKHNKSSCHGDCSSCNSSCTKIDWEEVRRSIHEKDSKGSH
ncbi:hypothetical protein C815_02046 [Firmicutes bacterium M10-2]|nr:hypothetical protein C815_02046 [Firmicutes bacterium M10-2]